MKSREYLIDVYNDTIRQIENGDFNTKLNSQKLTNRRIPKNNKIKKPGIILVENDDCINVALNLSKEGKTCMLNMASYKKPGGGVKTGAMAQEEELARRSNLMVGLDNRNFYPLQINEYIYTQDVTFFKNKYYENIDPFDCDVITIASVNLNGLDKPIDYEDVMSKKISTMLYTPHQYGCKNLVLSAFGCGVFKNDPHFVASMFKKLLDNEFASLYNKIVFAILNDNNSVGNNYEVFNDIM